MLVLGLASIPVFATSTAFAQTPPPSVGLETQRATPVETALWPRIEAINQRQVRQDRIMGVGFGITLLLLLVILYRQQRTVFHERRAPVPLLQRLAQLRLDAQLLILGRRQRRIKKLLVKIENSMEDDIETRSRIREALSAVVKENERLNAELERARPTNPQ